MLKTLNLSKPPALNVSPGELNDPFFLTQIGFFSPSRLSVQFGAGRTLFSAHNSSEHHTLRVVWHSLADIPPTASLAFYWQFFVVNCDHLRTANVV